MKKIMMKVIRVFLGISLVLIVLHYVYNLTSLPKEEILIPSLTTEALKKTDIIKPGGTFRLEGYHVTYVSFKSSDEKFILELEMNKKREFIKKFRDYYSIYALSNDNVDFDISNYVERNTIYIPVTETSRFDQLLIVKNVDNKPVVKLSIK